MSPLLGFSKLLEQLLDGSKTQTIRKPRKHPLKKGDLLHVYWKLRTPKTHKLGTAQITNITQKPFCKLTTVDFMRDGFGPLADETFWKGIDAFGDMYPELFLLVHWHDPFDIITFEWLEGPHPPKEVIQR